MTIASILTGCADGQPPSKSTEPALSTDAEPGGRATETPSQSPSGAAEVARDRPCAEFPGSMPQDDNVFGWWTDTPAHADGSIIRDPSEWPAEMREHLRVAVVDGDTGATTSTWDRTTCGTIDGYTSPVPTNGASADHWMIIDATSGTLIDLSPKPSVH